MNIIFPQFIISNSNRNHLVDEVLDDVLEEGEEEEGVVDVDDHGQEVLADKPTFSRNH